MSKTFEERVVANLCAGFNEKDRNRVLKYSQDSAVDELAEHRVEVYGGTLEDHKEKIIAGYIKDSEYSADRSEPVQSLNLQKYIIAVRVRHRVTGMARCQVNLAFLARHNGAENAHIL